MSRGGTFNGSLPFDISSPNYYIIQNKFNLLWGNLMTAAIPEITERVKEKSKFIGKLIDEISRVIVGQRYMIERLLLGLLADGHILVEGVPGLAKTTAIKTLSLAINTKFQRIQFTPDLLPADLLG